MTVAARNKQLVREAFQPWEEGNSAPFFALISENVKLTVIGTTAVSGVYYSKQALIEKAFDPLLDLLEGPLLVRLIDLTAEDEKIFLRFDSQGTAKTGLHYNQVYCFAMVMKNDRITEIVTG